MYGGINVQLEVRGEGRWLCILMVLPDRISRKQIEENGGMAALNPCIQGDGPDTENEEFLSRQLLTYLGNKRSLRAQLELAFQRISDALGGRRLRMVDVFSGSGFVSRLMRRYSSLVIANDLEDYAKQISLCYLSNHDDAPIDEIMKTVDALNREADFGVDTHGFIADMYAPHDDRSIQKGERTFYTTDNARRLDLFASRIQGMDEGIRPFLLGPLLSSASVHVNTGGVFKGFYKDRNTGIGKMGGAAGNCLHRILAPIRLEAPVSSAYNVEGRVYSLDALDLPAVLPEVDVCYLDPPYNQHPYGSNYFMLNLISSYVKPVDVSRVSGIPKDWNRSVYNVRAEAEPALLELIRRLPSRFVLVSLNNEGFINPTELESRLSSLGEVTDMVTPYNAYRASRNLDNRAKHVNEHLILLDRGW